MNRRTLSVALVALSLAASCSSVGYGDPNQTETLTIDYGSTDLQTLSGEMVDSLTVAPSLNYLDNSGKGEDKRVIVYMGGIENATSEHIDTKGIRDKIETALLKTGKFRIVAVTEGQAEIGDQVRFQQGSGRVREDMAREFGKQIGADVVIYGSLRSIEKKKGSSIESGGARKRDVYYQFVLKCANIDTGELMWSEEAELRKTSKTGIFGRT